MAIPKALKIVRQFYPNVEQVKDAKRGLYIEVTQGHSDSAAVRKHNACALALACKRTLPGVTGAVICLSTSYIVKGPIAYRYKTPPTVAREITSFDRKAGFSPGEYHLASVPPAMRLGNWRTYSKHTPVKRKMKYHHTTNVRELASA